MKADRHRRFGDLADDIAARLPDREGLVFGASRYTFREKVEELPLAPANSGCVFVTLALI